MSDTDKMPPVSRGTILIVDDHSDNVNLLNRLLNETGFMTLLGHDGNDAVRLARSAQPDIILLDINMPAMGGFEACQILKQDPRTAQIPIIFLSVSDDAESVVQAFRLGGADYITKPFKIEAVEARIQHQLDTRQQNRLLDESRERDRHHYETIAKMKDQFINAATHDLKNPLQVIFGYITLLQRNPAAQSDDDLQLAVGQIEAAAWKMQTLVTDMLDLASLDVGLALQPTPISYKSFMEDALRGFGILARRAGIELIYHAPPDDVIVTIDHKRMGQVVNNLVGNAIKYTQRGGTITVTAGKEEDDALIIVADTGLGVPEDALAHLFDAFYRVKNPEHSKIAGSGLGLSIVKTIIDKHNGTVEVTSQQGVGSQFTVRVPLEPK